VYRAFHNVLSDYKYLLQENQRTYLNGIVHSNRKTEKDFLTNRDIRWKHHGWHGTHRYDMQVLATLVSTWVHRYSSLLHWSVPKGTDQKTPLLVYGYNSSVCTPYVILICFNLNTFGTFCMKYFDDVKLCLPGCRTKEFQSKKLVTFCVTTRHHIPERSTFQKMFSSYVSWYG
jgi:hypothetical protein